MYKILTIDKHDNLKEYNLISYQRALNLFTRLSYETKYEEIYKSATLYRLVDGEEKRLYKTVSI